MSNINSNISFRQRSQEVLANPELTASYQKAMNFLVDKRKTQFPIIDQFELLRQQGEAIRCYSLNHLPQLLVQLEEKLQANGIKVHWAEDAAQANQIMLELCAANSGQHLVKGKSMVSEEIEFNHACGEKGIDVVESDMGEYIVQLAGEKPSHIIMPAIHKSKEEIAKLFHEQIPDTPYTDNVDQLIQIGRQVLREKFANADIGISGVNFAVAESGTLCLVENEGNGRMCTTIPRVHIAITGIEKVIAKLEYLPPLLKLLTRSATGQAITTYVNLISKPRQSDEWDGPEQVHLILLDNGRSQAYANDTLRPTLQCIRCGACMNHCPVYSRVGGHTYNSTYPGPIGALVAPHIDANTNAFSLSGASTLCGACAEVCPVKIPIPQLFINLRQANYHKQPAGKSNKLVNQGTGECWYLKLIWRGWQTIYANHLFYQIFSYLASRLNFLTPPWQGGWTLTRRPLRPSKRRLRDMIKEHC